ncbi:hypothetical protein MBLNU457_2339t1 [Dothideomycetes sp. NU457]
MSSVSQNLASESRALFFDVFGTCVDWRKSVTNALNESAEKALIESESISPTVREKAQQYTIETWGEFAQEWRTTYYKFTRDLAKDPSLSWKTVDDHHLESLRDILSSRGLMVSNQSTGNLWTDDEIKYLSTVWHRLESWPDTNEGLKILGTKYDTATLSNGNISLLNDMQAFSSMKFTHTFSSELFGSYKPNPAIYNGAAERLGLKQGQCVMVAAHLGDLEAAKGCGLRTIYVERPQEETYDVAMAREKGFVDLWIKEDEDGFLGICRELGLQA